MIKASLKLASSFRNKMILIFFAITIVPFIVFAYYAYLKSIEGIQNANATFSMSYLQQAKANFETYLTQVNDRINDLIGNRSLQTWLEHEPRSQEEEEAFAVNMLALVYQHKPQIDALRVRVYPLKPSLYPNYMNTMGVSTQVEQESWFKASSGSVVPTWHLFMPEKGLYGRPLLTYVKRFTGLYDTTPRGLIATDLAEDHLRRFFSPSKRMEGQKFLIVGRDGTVLFDSNDNEWTGQPVPSKRFMEIRENASEGAETLDMDGERKLITYAKMNSEPWTVVSLTPLHALTHPIKTMNKLLIVFLAIYLICSVGVVIYITMNFTQPVVKLVRLMRKLEKGEFDHKGPTSSREDEIGWLYRGFESMTRKIEALIEQTTLSERKKKELELQVLSHQINPHFLYNTLESIRWKAENHGRSDIGEMVSALGNLLRLSLNQGKDITTVGREVDQVKAYVQIEQARMGMPLRVLYFFDEEMLSLPFTRLLLQPLVENAIHHSIRDNFEKGKVILSGYVEENDIVIQITDNGRGIPESVLRQLDSEEADGKGGRRQGVGLRNVNERLKLYFGNGYKLTIDTGAGMGTKITLRHPVLENEGPEEAGGIQNSN
ncbi:sensor histidine kinase [Cohnella sp. CIP 111063]|jgi:two-component system sensor histidine kinase YesM|uniref:cache domain-containing sensor histidine kinase n=1 Tax=unclassified Cohnella TaxID=2636738 RepID=UPI000B8C59A4|nr:MULTISPECIES: sensor histidine kinase [unclassified Cohnella]OXS61770.1 sensor histidine kinase [Cohnella sp. CIP 111063]PRX74209.1 sensor histidine kinase YesM [Cohnella sp. SGD-V74]